MFRGILRTMKAPSARMLRRKPRARGVVRQTVRRMSSAASAAPPKPVDPATVARWNVLVFGSFVGGIGLFYTSITYSNIKYDIEEMEEIPFDSGLSKHRGESDSSSRYTVMRLFANKSDPLQPPLSLSSLAVGWAYGTPNFARKFTGFHLDGNPHVLRVGEKVGSYEVVEKTKESIVFAKKDGDLDVRVGLDLVRAKASADRDKYYAGCGVCVRPTSSTGVFKQRFVMPIQEMCFNVMLKYSGRYAQDLYGGAGASASLARDTMRRAVAQKKAIKQFKKGKTEDMGIAEAGEH